MSVWVTNSMDVLAAVKDKANYADIVKWFREQGDLNTEQLVLLADTIGEMSEEIFEHYQALCDILKQQLQKLRTICAEKDCQELFPDSSERNQLVYVLVKACEEKAVLAEKYTELMNELRI